MTVKNPFLVRSPYEELKHIRQHRLLMAISLATAVFSIPGTLLSLMLLASQPSWQTWTVLGLVSSIGVLSYSARVLTQRGHMTFATNLLFVPILLILGVVGLLLDGFFAILAPTLMIVVMIVGLLLEPKWGYFSAFLAGLIWLTVLVLHNSGVVVPVRTNNTVVMVSVTAIALLAFVFVALLSWLARDDLQQALNDATYELVQANRKLEEASHLKSQFTAHTSHELRSPLNAIISFTDLTLRGAYGPLSQKQQEKMDRVLQSGRRLLALIDDLLDLSKIEAGEVSIAQIPFPIGKLLETVQTTVEPIAEAKGLILSAYLSPAMPAEIIGDEKRLTQVLLNLTQNAVKYTEKGRVGIIIEPATAEQWRMTVQDTGPGIPERDFTRIFQEFARLESSGERIQGVGLGLAITNRLVTMMDGEIEVKSELGKGSTFAVVLPMKRPFPLAA
ncbi:MAG: hypothetical protein KDE56_14185 [Anaerolineales bacterium]|nr:hypothetical protein [Anaerolineales bacterium]